MKISIAVFIALFIAAFRTQAGDKPSSLEEVREQTMQPYSGPSVRDVDTSTLIGKTMCGYQGWFNAAGDGMDLNFRHWAKGTAMEPGTANIDLWPDVFELGPEERFATGFKHRDGRVAEVYSTAKRETVVRHFQWMRDYGIDGVFVQRFVSETRSPKTLRHINTVLANCREGANRNGRAYAVMYDISGLRTGHPEDLIEDWHALRSFMHIADDPSYLKHRGRPLVAVWGVGFFSEKRAYTLADCTAIVDALKSDGCSVMLGVPTTWRNEGQTDAQRKEFLALLARVDVISPWAVGRIRTPEQAAKQADNLWKQDLEWCGRHNVDFLPVVFPGFSWHNLHNGPLDQIPRRRGAFLWSQFQSARRIGAQMAYVAMFDEVDEGTAIFKCTNDVPVGEPSQFVTYEGQPSDRYLKLVGAGAKMIRGELPSDTPLPP